MAEVLNEIEQGLANPQEVQKYLNGKFIKVGGNRVGYTFKGEWKWTTWAIGRYSAEAMEMAKGYAEGD